MTLLVTGFGAFGEVTSNPSGRAVELLAGQWTPPGEAGLVTEVLPVSFSRATARVGALIAQHRPAVVLGVGLAEGRRRLGLERVALNLADARIPDVDGAQPVDEEVRPGEPTARLATLPVKACLRALHDAGLPAELSLTAGSYVCNAVMYAALAGAPAGTRAGFLHVPSSDVVAVADVVRALELVLATVLRTGEDLRVPGGTEY